MLGSQAAQAQKLINERRYLIWLRTKKLPTILWSPILADAVDWIWASAVDFPEKPKPTHEGKYRSIEWAIGDLESVTDESVPNQSQYFGASRAKNGNGQGDESNKKDQPAYTIRANPKSRVQFHYALDRRLTVRECARIQTFPDDFVFLVLRFLK